MNTQSNNIIINPEFAELFAFKNEKEEIEHNAQMISYRILSEVEKICDDRKIKKKDLAELVGTSKSYITQLFNGSKSINTDIMAKFEKALHVSFEIRLKLNQETYNTYLCKQISEDYFKSKRLVGSEGVWYYWQFDRKTEDLMRNLETDNIEKQIA
jgi:transcriptional regulator with XRE-family HTH domain